MIKFCLNFGFHFIFRGVISDILYENNNFIINSFLILTFSECHIISDYIIKYLI